MALIKSVKGIHPTWGENCFIADNATLVGDLIIGDNCSIWFNAVLRADVNKIRIGNKTNIQDGVVIHCTFQQSETHIGNEVSIGHNAIVHGCTLHSQVLVGMGAIIMDNAVVEENCLIAAGAVILENQICESGYIYAGIPAKKIKALTKENFEKQIMGIANNYVKYADWFR